jgi:hypothetical protein
MTLSLFLCRFETFTGFASVLGAADFVTLEETTTVEAHVFQPFHLLRFLFYTIIINETPHLCDILSSK